MRRSLAFAVVAAAASLLLVAPAPSYDPWAWLLWGGELLEGRLDTVEGPAFKPLPVFVCALLSFAGPAAPWLWVLLVRVAALVGLVLAFGLGRRLAGGSTVAGLAAAAAVALCGPFLDHAATGLAEPVLITLALGGAEAWRRGHPRWAAAAALGCALLRVETWPFLVALGALAWRRHPGARAHLVAGALLVPAAWFLPELVGSGDLLRSADRAQVPNPGQPALSAVPALASARAGLGLPLWPLWAGAAALAALAFARGDVPARRALVPALAGGAWMALVAAMAQAGFSGEPRYHLPGAALVAVSGAVGVVAAVRAVATVPGAPAVAVAVLVTVAIAAATPRAATLGDVRDAQSHQWRLQRDLERAVAAAGGAAWVLRCGQPYVGPLRGPLMAYRLGVAKQLVEPDRPPTPPGVVFRSAIAAGAEPAPTVAAGFVPVASVGTWEVFASC